MDATVEEKTGSKRVKQMEDHALVVMYIEFEGCTALQVLKVKTEVGPPQWFQFGVEVEPLFQYEWEMYVGV